LIPLDIKAILCEFDAALPSDSLGKIYYNIDNNADIRFKKIMILV